MRLYLSLMECLLNSGLRHMNSIVLVTSACTSRRAGTNYSRVK